MDEIKFTDILRKIWKSKLLIICVTAIITLLSGLWAFLIQEPTYEVNAGFMLNNSLDLKTNLSYSTIISGSNSQILETIGELEPQYLTNYIDSLKTTGGQISASIANKVNFPVFTPASIAQMMSSDEYEIKALQAKKLDPKQLKVDVSYNAEQNIIYISVKGNNQNDVDKAQYAMLEYFDDYFNELADNKIKQIITETEQLIVDMETKIDDLMNDFKPYKNRKLSELSFNENEKFRQLLETYFNYSCYLDSYKKIELHAESVFQTNHAEEMDMVVIHTTAIDDQVETPNKLMFLVIGLLFGLILGVVVAFLKDSFAKK